MKRYVWAMTFVSLIVLPTLVLSATGCETEFDQARDLEWEGDLAGAIEAYSVFLEEHPDNLEALNGLALDLVLAKDYDSALPVQERIVGLDKKDLLTRIELGFNYLNHQGRSSDAVRVLAEAVALDPSAQHHAFLAQAQKTAGDREGAEKTLRSALEIDPTYPFVYSLLRIMFVEDGRTEDVKELQRFADMHGVQIEETRQP